MLKFRVEGQKLTWENPDEVVVAGTKKYLECYFEFDGDAWSGFEYIEAFFKNGRDKPIRMLLSANRIWKEDGLCLAAGDWSVYLRAVVSKKKVDEEGNVVYEEDGVTPVMELEKQMTSSSISIRVLAHGQFENAQNSFESPEIAEQYIEQMLDIGNAMSVFEEYNPDKTYVKGNKVAYEGSSYVLTADEALGTNPTDTGSWLCIAEKGDKGEDGTKYYGFPEISLDVGSELLITFNFDEDGIDGNTGLSKQDYPGIDEWRMGDMLISANGRVLLIADIIRSGAKVKWLAVRCVSDLKGEKGDKGDKGVTGGKIFSYALGYGKDVEVGSYKMAIPPFELIENGIDYNDIIVDTDGGCIFQYVASIGDDEAMLPAEGLHCIANPNGDKGDKGDKGKDGTLWTPLYFELDIKKGENKKAKFDFNRNILYWGSAEYDGLNKDDYPNVYEWTVGDFFVSNDRKILQITHLEWPNSELLNADVTCISEHNLIVDQVFDGDSENAVSGKALAEVLKVLSEQLAFADFSNVSNEDFRAKAEEAGVGGDNAELLGNAPMVFKGVVSELPETANEGEVYKITNTTTSNLYVRHNGEWVEISKDGVTKAEMESYIEETLLGGEW